LDFRTDSRLANITDAHKFAAALVGRTRFDQIPVYLGWLRSKEYMSLDRSRRNGIREVWLEYLKSAHAKPQFAIDGPGLLKTIL
jgi:hypothetical protein